ncbi:MAG: hypothetical protein ACKVOE_01535 [Rickettsiales bacterium]
MNPLPSPTGEPVGMTATNDNDTAIAARRAVPLPAASNDNDTLTLSSATRQLLSPARAPHTQNGATLSPTAEFTRIFLLAWIIRYVFRGAAKLAFNPNVEGFGSTVLNALSKPGQWLQKKYFLRTPLSGLEAAAYSTMVGLGSGYLSYSYGKLVRSDIENLFRETVGYEMGIPQEKVTFDDIKRSKNAIVLQTVHNYHIKLAERLGTDALFLAAAPLKSEGLTDLLLGTKGIQIFADTWKRKTTMFEDLITFVNNKINPRNGIGQPIGVGEVFDLYQHYAERFHPEKMFTNVLEAGTGEGVRWAQSQPIFQRLTELMNLTYAYKHSTMLGPDGHAIKQADFTLPKLIYLLGHDLINIDKPEQTLTAIELANRYGIDAVKQMESQLAAGATLAQVQQHFPYPANPNPHEAQKGDEKNGVIAKGSTMQLDSAPGLQVQTRSIEHHQPIHSATVQPNLA